MKLLGPFMPLYWDDFIGGTVHFEAQEVGAYLLLLHHQWAYGAIPSDPRAVSRIARADYESLVRVIEKFGRDPDGNLVNRRLAEVRSERADYMTRARESGSKGGRKRWAKRDGEPIGGANRPPNGSGYTMSDTSPSPSPPPSSTPPSGGGGVEGDVPPSKPPTARRRRSGFKAWDGQKFREECRQANETVGLSADELEDFVEYWLEPSSSGRPRFSLEKTWDSSRRLKTALRLIYHKHRTESGGNRRRVSLEAAS